MVKLKSKVEVGFQEVKVKYINVYKAFKTITQFDNQLVGTCSIVFNKLGQLHTLDQSNVSIK